MFEVGQRVWIRNYRSGPRWVLGVVEQANGRDYHVRTRGGQLWHRHVDQVRTAGREDVPQVHEPEEPLPPQEQDFPAGSVETPESPPTPESSDEHSDESHGSLEQNDAFETNARGLNEDETLQSTEERDPRYPTRARQPPDRYM